MFFGDLIFLIFVACLTPVMAPLKICIVSGWRMFNMARYQFCGTKLHGNFWKGDPDW